jgi:hypothetical protein
VTQAQAATVMAGARAGRSERIAKEWAILLAFACGEADEVAQRVSLLEGEFMVARLDQEKKKS